MPSHPHVHDHSAAGNSRLHEHMLRDHGRTGRDTAGLPLADLHRFEHVEQALGLNDLGHRHPAGVGTVARAQEDPEEAALTGVLA